MLEILSFSDLEGGFTSFKENKRANFCGEKSTVMLSKVSIFREKARKLKIECHPRNHTYPI